MKQLNGIDASFIHLERGRNHFQVGTLLFYDVSTAKEGFVRFKDILRTFESRISRESILRRKLRRVPLNLDNPYWVDDPDFDIEHHVRHIALPKPGDWRQLCILVARIHARPLDFGKPLWEVYVIEGIDNVEGIPAGGFALYVKLHHCAVDGTSGNELIAAIHDLEPFPPKKALKADAKAPDTATPTQVLMRAGINLIKQPRRVASLAQTLTPAMKRIRKGRSEHLFTPLGANERIRFNDAVSGNIVMDAVIMNLDDVKTVKNALPDITINDVLLAIVAGGLLRYLESKQERPLRDLCAGMPINIRPALAGAKTDERANLASIVKVSLKTTIRDPMQRLAEIHRSAVEGKAYNNAVGAEVMIELGRTMPALLMSIAARAVPILMTGPESPLVNTVITNTPGSQVPLYMAGARLSGMCNMGIVMDGLGLFHAVSSYCGTATVSFQACRQMMPDPGHYRDCLQASFDELRAAAAGRQGITHANRKPLRRGRKEKIG